ncbi:MAG: hypothetical protein ACHP7K_07105, partial [Actinomycetales bacterium]
MPYTAENWPIAAALLQFPGTLPDGSSVQDAPAEQWQNVFSQVAGAGFSNVDLTDSWVRPGDLPPSRLEELKAAAASAGVGLPS